MEVIRIITAGKFADNSQSLSGEHGRRTQRHRPLPPAAALRRAAFLSNAAGLCASLAPPSSEFIVTLHVIVRPPSAGKGKGPASGSKEHNARSCWCVVC